MFTDLELKIMRGDFFKKWHWFSYHFATAFAAPPNPFALGIIKSCLEIDVHIPGFALRFFQELERIGNGRVKDTRDYEQSMQKVAELLVIHRLVTWPWDGGATFALEPVASGSKKNPELTIRRKNQTIGVEVKCPATQKRYEHLYSSKNSTQFLSRWLANPAALENEKRKIILPRDNTIKDFLVSAEGKFESFRKSEENFVSILVIVWDEFLKEPVSALLSDTSGLLTPRSYYKNKDGKAITYPSLDGVFLLGHLHKMMAATRESMPLYTVLDPLGYGQPDEHPIKLFVPLSERVPADLIECLQGVIPRPELGPDYVPGEMIMWFDIQ